MWPIFSCLLAVFRGEKLACYSGFVDTDRTGMLPPINTIFLLFSRLFFNGIIFVN